MLRTLRLWVKQCGLLRLILRGSRRARLRLLRGMAGRKGHLATATRGGTGAGSCLLACHGAHVTMAAGVVPVSAAASTAEGL